MCKIIFQKASACILAINLIFSASLPATAHEYWIEPLKFQVKVDGEIIANQKVGQDFKGNNYPLIPQEFITSGLFSLKPKLPFKGDIGDIPALKVRPQHAGLHVLVVSTTPDRLTYEKFAKFQTFVKAQGLDWAVGEHRKRGLPETGFTEAYSRHAKALVQVGPARGNNGTHDVVVGMPIELVAEKNPYALPLSPGVKLPVRLLWQGKPLKQSQIKIFHKNSDKLDISNIRTDDEGRALVPLGLGGKFMLSAVQIIPWNEKPGVQWRSYWASMTFKLGSKP
jgi:uncharacterized GH25 family protein